MEGKNENVFLPDQKDKQEADQGFDSRNQYSGSGNFSLDQEEAENSNNNLDAIIGQNQNSIPNKLDSDHFADQESNTDFEEDEK
jgi:hypothetical protein